jgi:hypothetical protein
VEGNQFLEIIVSTSKWDTFVNILKMICRKFIVLGIESSCDDTGVNITLFFKLKFRR